MIDRRNCESVPDATKTMPVRELPMSTDACPSCFRLSTYPCPVRQRSSDRSVRPFVIRNAPPGYFAGIQLLIPVTHVIFPSHSPPSSFPRTSGVTQKRKADVSASLRLCQSVTFYRNKHTLFTCRGSFKPSLMVRSQYPLKRSLFSYDYLCIYSVCSWLNCSSQTNWIVHARHSPPSPPSINRTPLRCRTPTGLRLSTVVQRCSLIFQFPSSLPCYDRLVSCITVFSQ